MLHIRYRRQISRIMVAFMLLEGIFWYGRDIKTAYAADNTESYRNVVYALDENNKDAQGICYHISGDYAMVGDTSFGAADYQGAGDGIVTIPDAVSLDGRIYDVTRISSYAFNRCSKLKEIVVGDNVQEISEGAFSLSGLGKIHIGKQVRKIETSRLIPFEGTKLEEITIDPENTSYTVKDGVLFTADMTELIRYPSQDSRTEYVIPDSVTKISMYAFEMARNIKDMVIPAGIEEIGAAAFEASTALYSVQDLRGVKQLGAMAFADATNLKMLLLGDDLKIYMGAAYRNTNNIIIRSGIEMMYFPDGTQTTYEVLNGCYGVKNVVFGKGMTLHRGDCAFCKDLETIILPEDITAIPENFAKGCTSLKSIYIPDTVTEIGENAFEGDDVVLYGKKDSVVESFAKEAGITFQDIDTHVHHYEQHTFYEDAHVKITGMLCAECGQAYNCEQSLIREIPGAGENSPSPTAEPIKTPEATQSPTPTKEPEKTPEETQSPMPTKEPEKTPEAAQSPTLTQSPTPTKEPEKTPEAAQSPTPTQSASPTKEPEKTPEETQSPSPTKEPEKTPEETQSPSPTAEPEKTPEETQSPTPTAEPEKTPEVIQSTSPTAEPIKTSEATQSPALTEGAPELAVSGLRVYSKDNRHVTLSWDYNTSVTGYEIYRSTGKNGTYRLLQTLSGETTSYKNNDQKAAVVYYYRLRAWWTDGRMIMYGSFTKPRAIRVTRLVTPVISVQKKRVGGIPYLKLRVRKYNADKLQLYVATNQGRYKKIALKNNSIKKLHGVYRIRYQKGKKTFWVRIRTYKKLWGKKMFSYYSKPVKIKV